MANQYPEGWTEVEIERFERASAELSSLIHSRHPPRPTTGDVRVDLLLEVRGSAVPRAHILAGPVGEYVITPELYRRICGELAGL